MAPLVREVLIVIVLALLCKAMSIRVRHQIINDSSSTINPSFCFSWRLGVEVNNVLPWSTVPTHCMQYIEDYMIHSQYEKDLELIMEEALRYMNGIVRDGDGMDVWVIDVDDTCISNVFYYKSKRYGCDPYDPLAFRAWALKGWCTAIPSVLDLFNKLIDQGFKVILLTGRDENTFHQVTIENLHNQGFIGYERLVMRSAAYKGQSGVKYKSSIRKKLEDEGYRIWGNMGDQWSDLQGYSLGNRTFKLPNPMYFVP